MKKIYSTYLSVVLSVLLLLYPIDLSALFAVDTYHAARTGPYSVFAEETEEAPFVLSVTDVTAAPGELVRVDIRATGNTGFTRVVLMLETALNSPLIPVMSGGIPMCESGDVDAMIAWQSRYVDNICYYYMATERFCGNDGVLMSAYFRVAEDARTGSYPVQLSFKNLTNESEAVTADAVSGSVHVGEPQITTLPTMLTTTTTTETTTTTTTTTTIVLDSKPEPYRYGIDVSRWQGTVDWAKVKNSGKVDFAIMRAGYGKEYDQVDPSFHTNMKNAQAEGIPCGVYWYSYAMTAADAKQEAKVFLDTIKGYQFEYPVVFDIEDPTQMELTKTEVGQIIDAFCSAVEAEGYYCVLYSYASFLNSYVPAATLKKYDIWVAHTKVSKPDFTGDYGIWQYSHTGTVSGISGDVDMNYAYRDYPMIIKNGHYNGF